jgi:hypothetical protein
MSNAMRIHQPDNGGSQHLQNIIQTSTGLYDATSHKAVLIFPQYFHACQNISLQYCVLRLCAYPGCKEALLKEKWKNNLLRRYNPIAVYMQIFIKWVYKVWATLRSPRTGSSRVLSPFL